MYKHIAINGDLGSGKSSVARHLAERLRMRLVSTGEVQRSIAASLSLSTLETNLRAEYDELIDAQVDSITKDLANAEEPIIFDSRMAWRMVPAAFKVHLVVDPAVAAIRLHKERSSEVEGYASVEEARNAAEERYQSERRRFLAKYDADVSVLQNYHLVIDASYAAIEEVAAQIESAYRSRTSNELSLYLSPRRVLPGRDPGEEADSLRFNGEASQGMIDAPDPVVGYSRPFFYVINGLSVVSQAIRRSQPLVKAVLLARSE